MGKRSQQIKTENLSRLLIYILGQSPYEFGIVPSDEGFVSFKELLWALHEEPGFSYVRRSHLNEILIGKDRDLFEVTDRSIRVKERRWQFDFSPAQFLPKILFVSVKRKAYPVIREKGLVPSPGKYIVLSPSKEFSMRIGRRRDSKPVLVEVSALAAQRQGCIFYPFGSLFLSPEVGPSFISGPPVKQETDQNGNKSVQRRKAEKPKSVVVPSPTPGTFPMEVSKDPHVSLKRKGRKKKTWKEEARKARRRGKKGQG